MCRIHALLASSHQLFVPRYQLSMYGRRAFSAAAPTVWNLLPVPEDLQDPECSVNTYRQWLKTSLFSQCWCVQRIRRFDVNALYKFAFDTDIDVVIIN